MKNSTKWLHRVEQKIPILIPCRLLLHIPQCVERIQSSSQGAIKGLLLVKYRIYFESPCNNEDRDTESEVYLEVSKSEDKSDISPRHGDSNRHLKGDR